MPWLCLLVRLRGFLAELPLPGPLQTAALGYPSGSTVPASPPSFKEPLSSPPHPRPRGRQPPTLPALEVRVSPIPLVCFRPLGLGQHRRPLRTGSEPSRKRLRSASASSPCRSTLRAASHSAGGRWRLRMLFSREQTATPFCGCCIAKVRCLSGPRTAPDCVGLVPVPGLTGQELPLPLVLQMKLSQRLPLKWAQWLSWTQFIGSS